MPIINEKISLDTKGFNHIIDITKKISELIAKHDLNNAQALIYTPGSTASITSIEYEPGLLKDLPEVLDKIAPMNHIYHHDETWQDGNGYAHVRASMIGNSLNIPIIEGTLSLGTWQQIVLIDFDNKPRTRHVLLQIIH